MFKQRKPILASEQRIIAKAKSKEAGEFSKGNISQDVAFMGKKAMHPSAKAFFPKAFQGGS